MGILVREMETTNYTNVADFVYLLQQYRNFFRRESITIAGRSVTANFPVGNHRPSVCRRYALRATGRGTEPAAMDMDALRANGRLRMICLMRIGSALRTPPASAMRRLRRHPRTGMLAHAAPGRPRSRVPERAPGRRARTRKGRRKKRPGAPGRGGPGFCGGRVTNVNRSEKEPCRSRLKFKPPGGLSPAGAAARSGRWSWPGPGRPCRTAPGSGTWSGWRPPRPCWRRGSATGPW